MKRANKSAAKRTKSIIAFNVIFLFFLWAVLAAAVNIFSLLPNMFKEFAANQEVKFPYHTILVLNSEHIIGYCLAGAVALLVSVKMFYRSYLSFRSLNNDEKGSRQWTDLKELKKEYRAIPEKNKEYSGHSGFPISRYKSRIFIDDSPVNNLIIGTTRSGKGETYIIPAIDIYSRAEGINKSSIIAADPKGELAASSRRTLEKRGYTVHILDLLNFGGLSYNPLELIKETYMRGDIAEAQTLTDTLGYILFSDPHSHDKTWTNWSIALTNALILAVVIDCCKLAQECTDKKEKDEHLAKINMYSVVRLLTDLGASSGDDESSNKLPIDIFFDVRADSDIAKMQYAAVNYASSKTKGNIFANTLSVLTKFTMDSIAKMTSCNSLDFKDIGFNTENPTAVFLVTPDYDTSKNFLVAMFISQLYFVLAKNASISGSGKCLREVVFLLDEFGNIPQIPNMESIITVCLGRNIKFTLCVQAYSQLNDKYGDKTAQTIIGNCGNQIYLLTIENQTAEYFSKLIGNETITVQIRSGDLLSLNKSFSEHIDSKPLLNSNELMEFTLGESAVVRVTKRQDKKGRRITPRPILNRGKTKMKYRYEYLNGAFNTSNSYVEVFVDYNCMHTNLQLDSVCYSSSICMTVSDVKGFNEQEACAVNTEQNNILPNEYPIYPYLSSSEKRAIDICISNSEQIENMSISDFAILFEFLHDSGNLNNGKYEELKRIYAAVCEKAGI